MSSQFEVDFNNPLVCRHVWKYASYARSIYGPGLVVSDYRPDSHHSIPIGYLPIMAIPPKHADWLKGFVIEAGERLVIFLYDRADQRCGDFYVMGADLSVVNVDDACAEALRHPQGKRSKKK